MSLWEIGFIVGAGAVASLVFGLLKSLCSGAVSKARPASQRKSTPASSRAKAASAEEVSHEGLVRAAAADEGPKREQLEDRVGDMVEQVASRLRIELRRHFERSFWAGVWVNFFFFLLGSAAAFLISAGYVRF